MEEEPLHEVTTQLYLHLELNGILLVRVYS